MRNSQRIEQAVARKQLYQQIMEKPTTKLFYRLINRNRNSRTSTTTCIEIDGEKEYCHSNQRKVFANYYEDLSMPKKSEYDNSYLDLCQTRQNLIEKFYKENPVTSDPYTETEIQKSIETLNVGKSPDEYGLTAEHLKNAKSVLTPVLTTLFNKIKETIFIPRAFKTGILTPVMKSGKNPIDVKLQRNYCYSHHWKST